MKSILFRRAGVVDLLLRLPLFGEAEIAAEHPGREHRPGAVPRPQPVEGLLQPAAALPPGVGGVLEQGGLDRRVLPREGEGGEGQRPDRPAQVPVRPDQRDGGRIRAGAADQYYTDCGA